LTTQATVASSRRALLLGVIYVPLCTIGAIIEGVLKKARLNGALVQKVTQKSYLQGCSDLNMPVNLKNAITAF
jgi:hypothetical protein